MNDIILHCNRCNDDVVPVEREAGPHIKALCPICYGYIKSLNKEEKGEDMSELEVFFEYPDSKYGEGIMLEEYNDRISLVLAQKGKGEGTAWKKWAYPQNKERQPTERLSHGKFISAMTGRPQYRCYGK